MSQTTTPQELRTLADALRDASDGIDAKIKSTLDPLSPQGQHLRDIALHLATYALAIGTMAVGALAPGVDTAIDDLTGQVNDAQQTLANIQGAEKILTVAAALLSVAAAVASRDPLGAVQGVDALTAVIKNANAAVA
jgi:hypothetical protein